MAFKYKLLEKVTFYTGNYYNGYDTFEFIFTETGLTVTKKYATKNISRTYKLENMYKGELVKSDNHVTITENYDDKKRDEFIEVLMKLKMEKWKHNYIDLSDEDGYKWEVTLTFKKGTEEFSGNKKYPDSWSDFDRLTKKYVEVF